MSEIEKMQESIKEARTIITQIQTRFDINNTLLTHLTLNRLESPTAPPPLPKKMLDCYSLFCYVIGVLAAVNMFLFTLVVAYSVFYSIFISIHGK